MRTKYGGDNVKPPDVLPVTVYIQLRVGRKRNGLIATMDPPDIHRVRFDIIGKSGGYGTTVNVDCVRAMVDRDRPIRDSVPDLDNGDSAHIIPMMAGYIAKVWNITARGLTVDKFDLGYDIPRKRRQEDADGDER